MPMVTYESFQPSKLHDLTLITWQIGESISPLSRDLWLLNWQGTEFREDNQNANA